MANEFTYTTRFAVDNGNFEQVIDFGSLRDDQAGIGMHGGVVIVGTSEEDLATGDISTPGWLVIRNLDATNFVTYGPKSGGAMVAFGRLNAGDCHRVYLKSGVTLRWQADTASVKVQTALFEA